MEIPDIRKLTEEEKGKFFSGCCGAPTPSAARSRAAGLRFPARTSCPVVAHRPRPVAERSTNRFPASRNG